LHDLPPLGVGITYSRLLDPLLDEHSDLIDVIEVEPQTSWIKTGDINQPYRPDNEVMAALRARPARKLVHSVGAPVGGAAAADPIQLRLLAGIADELEAPWVSEHLSFNRTADFATGFFLPPRQTPAGVEVAVAAIRRFREEMGRPVAIETGVNYLRPRGDELPDGTFVARVSGASDCGVLLDLHNLWCNQRNGRESIAAFLAQLELDRVWEVHLAGGMELDGFWLDAHSGAVPSDLLELAVGIIPRLPNLRAIVFEILPSFVPEVGLPLIRDQLVALRELWELRRTAPNMESRSPGHRVGFSAADAGCVDPSPQQWEEVLGGLVVGHPTAGQLSEELASDPGIGILRTLVGQFRASMVVAVLTLTSRLLLLSLGRESFEVLLQGFWSRCPPQMYGILEGQAFGDYLRSLDLRVPQLSAVLDFELAALATIADGRTRVASFGIEPIPLLRALAESRLPSDKLQAGRFEIELTGQEATTTLDLEGLRDEAW
jgi:uncharacterized protein (UPF0276 family)